MRRVLYHFDRRDKMKLLLRGEKCSTWLCCLDLSQEFWEGLVTVSWSLLRVCLVFGASFLMQEGI